jgi:hypothetical protein
MTSNAPASPPPPGAQPCPDRVEVERDQLVVPGATVKAWVAHLRSHGWLDKDLELVWLTRARQGLTR